MVDEGPSQLEKPLCNQMKAQGLSKVYAWSSFYSKAISAFSPTLDNGGLIDLN